VLINLLSNALKYTPEKGTVCVGVNIGTNLKETGPLCQYMEISVSDTGKGVNEKELKKSSTVFIKVI
jgi:phoR_proteo: phosphate regulon sensor kinase PhoR